MADKISVDIYNKIINVIAVPTLVDGNYVVELDVKIDIYSDLKEEWASTELFRRRSFPMRAVGGNPLPGSKQLGSSFFLSSDWKIMPYDGQDHIFRVNGNLYSEDGTSPFIPVTGNYNVFLEQQVSSLVDSTVQQLSEIQYISFNGGVTIDHINGSPGIDYPIGTNEYPSNNVADTLTIADNRGFDTIFVIGDQLFTTGDNLINFKIIGQSPALTTLTCVPDAVIQNCDIRSVRLTGTLDGGTIVQDSVVQNLTYVNGFIYRCMIDPGTITLGGSQPAHFLNCYSGVPGTNTPIIDMGGNEGQNTPLAIRDYNGGIKLINKTGDAACSIDLNSGQIIIDSTCTNGEIVVRGVGNVVDESGNHMGTGIYNGNLSLINEVNSGNHIHDIWWAMGFDPTKPELETLTPAKIADAIWDEPTADHLTAGTFGEAVSQTSGLSPTESLMLLELYRLMGLDPTKPLVVSDNNRSAGAEILQTIQDNGTQTTITRN